MLPLFVFQVDIFDFLLVGIIDFLLVFLHFYLLNHWVNKQICAKTLFLSKYVFFSLKYCTFLLLELSNIKMVKIGLQIKAQMESCSGLTPEGEDFRWYLKLRYVILTQIYKFLLTPTQFTTF